MGLRGAVATSHPLAVQAGMRMLLQGGNAVDAAIATAAALTVVEPTCNGLGGDAFALVWDGAKLHGLNASGRAPMGLDIDEPARLRLNRIPNTGWLPVTVPGVVSGWAELASRFGTMPLLKLLTPAIEYAEMGHPVPPVIAGYWRVAEKRFVEFDEFRKAFLPRGRAPLPGEVFRLPEQGETLRLIGESNGEAFYRGELAERIARHSEATGGYITYRDLSQHRAEWVEPISLRYREFDIWEIPPNGQGIVALIALGILEGFDIASLGHVSKDELHLVIEALKLAFADAYAFVADPLVADVPTEALLNKDYLAIRRSLISLKEAMDWPEPGDPESVAVAENSADSEGESRRKRHKSCGAPSNSDTVYLCTADADGMMVSFIQSNYMGFGSGIVIPGTGIAMQNRGCGFTLEPGHPNCLAPGKRPYHTIIPGFITQNNTPLSAFGVMGGDMQPQGHVQVILGLIDHALNPQAAIDAPRVRVLRERRVAIESSLDPEVIQNLSNLGHQVEVVDEPSGFGGGQIIWRDPETGVFISGSEPRKDGMAAAW
jgi:gamma-glutamyltranspeptidase/glutathione hydrolase